MRLKKIYHEKTGTYIYVDLLTGAGLLDTIKKMASKVATQALESGSKKAGDELGKFVVEKITTRKKDDAKITPRGPTLMKDEKITPRGPILMKSMKPVEDIHTRINKLL